MMHNYFTITAGRTGSAWLASFLSQNLNISEVHEFLGINDFGNKMPDIRTMRNFNNFGNNEFVQNFWKRKFEYIPNELYSETNHTLCKCGLVENIILNKRENYTTLIILKRDITDQCVSYLERNDFGNITIAWQWYLHPSYLKKIINPKPFMQFGNLGQPLWYCYEMAARQEYYSQKFSDKLKMIEVTLEEVVTNIGAKKLHLDLDLSGECKIPAEKNQNKANRNTQLITFVKEIVEKKIKIDMPDIVKKAIKNGFTF